MQNHKYRRSRMLGDLVFKTSARRPYTGSIEAFFIAILMHFFDFPYVLMLTPHYLD